MSVKVTVNDIAWPKGTELAVVGLGIFVNGDTRTLTDEEVEQYETAYGQSVSAALKGSTAFKTASGGDK